MLTNDGETVTCSSHFVVAAWKHHFFLRLMIQNVQVDDALLHLEALLVSVVQKKALMLVSGKNDAWVEFSDDFVALLSDRKEKEYK